MNRKQLIFLSIFSIFVLSILSILLGSVKIPISQISNSTYKYIITKIRLPRTIGAIIVGACLALSGLVFQSVFKNPMADSYMLGVSSSASFTVCLALLAFDALSKSVSLSIFAFAGSTLCSLYLFYTSKKNTLRLLLTGISLNFFFSAATTLLICLNKQQLDTILFWTMGSLSGLNWSKIIVLGIILLIILTFELKNKFVLDLLLLDDETALSSGINIFKIRIKLLIIASITTSFVVSYCGVIGFVGMLSSHVVRLVMGPSHKKTIIPTAIFGSMLLLFSDIVSRTIVAPSELPIGVISSIIGAPILFALIKRNKSWIA